MKREKVVVLLFDSLVGQLIQKRVSLLQALLVRPNGGLSRTERANKYCVARVCAAVLSHIVDHVSGDVCVLWKIFPF
jgi:hypothetical protein